MTFTDMLRDATAQNNSLLCVGLDPEPTRFPAGMQGDAHKIYDFCAAIVDATADLAIAFKPQIAYFAAHRAEEQLDRLRGGCGDEVGWRCGGDGPGGRRYDLILAVRVGRRRGAAVAAQVAARERRVGRIHAAVHEAIRAAGAVAA